MDYLNVVVVDNGSGNVKCGFGGDNLPQHTFPSVIGRPLVRSTRRIHSGDLKELENKDVLVADECAKYRNLLDISYPMENGIVKNWDDMNIIWRHTFGPERLDIDPTVSHLMLTEPSLNSALNRQKTIEALFEEFNFHSLYIGTQAVMALYAHGLTTGICVDSGDGVTHICPVYNGQILSHLSRRLDVAGRHITKELSKLLLLRGYHFNHSADFEIMRELKETHCYVAYDVAVDERLIQETTVLNKEFTLPDRRKIIVAEELFRAPEILFKPSLLGQDVAGISEVLFRCVRAADIDIRVDLFKNILLSGGTTLLPGFAERLEKEVNQLYLDRVLKGDEKNFKKYKTRVFAPAERMSLVFQGASMLAKLIEEQAPEWWITRQQYMEEGVNRCMEKLSTVVLK